MKTTTNLIAAALGLTLLAGPLTSFAAEKTAKLKPYPLKTCAVSGEKLGEMGDPYVFEYKGREIKMCCKGCLKDFKKDPAKYIKKLEKAEVEAKAKNKAK